MLLTEYQSDILKELINIGVGKAAGVLNEMVESHIDLCVPEIKVIPISSFEIEMDKYSNTAISTISLGFQGVFSGTTSLILPRDSASNLVSILTGEEIGTPDLDSVKAGTLTEVGNIVLNGVIGSLGNILNHNILYSLPDYEEKPMKDLNVFSNLSSDSILLLVKTRFTILDFQIEGEIIIVFEINSFESLINIIGSQFEEKHGSGE